MNVNNHNDLRLRNSFKGEGVEVGVFPASHWDFPLSCWTFPLFCWTFSLWGFSHSRRIYIYTSFLFSLVRLHLFVPLHLVLLLFVSVYVCCSSFPIKNSHQTHLHWRRDFVSFSGVFLSLAILRVIHRLY